MKTWTLILAFAGLNPGSPAIVYGYATLTECRAAARYAFANPATRDLSPEARQKFWDAHPSYGWSPKYMHHDCIPGPDK